MLGVTDYGAFVVAIIVFLLIPGPGNLALISSTGKGGIRGGLAATIGVILGDQVLMWLAVAATTAPTSKAATSQPTTSPRSQTAAPQSKLTIARGACSHVAHI